MTTASVWLAWIQCRDELPELLGPEGSHVCPQLDDIFVRLQTTGDSSQRAVLVAKLAMISAPYPEVFNRLQPVFREFSREQDTTLRQNDQVVASQEPEQLRKLAEVFRQSQPQGLESIAEAVKPPPDELESETELVILRLTRGSPLGRRPGTSSLRVFDIPEATLSQERLQTLAAELGLGDMFIPCDLDVSVETEVREGAIVLRYSLFSPNQKVGYVHQTFEQTVTGRSSLKEYQEQLRDIIEALGQGRDAAGYPLQPEQIEDELKGLGRDLYRELFPPGLMDAYRDFRELVRTLLINSDEPWIPWELIRPYDNRPGRPIIDDGFLCERFQLTRWLGGSLGGASVIHVARSVCVEASQELPYASAERQCLVDLATQYGLEDCSPKVATATAVLELLDRGGIQLWHFTAHGNVDSSAAQEAAIILTDGSRLRARQIQGPRETLIGRDRPLIFFNACRVGQQGWSLTRLDGWAARLVGNSRCGAFIGPLWQVNDWLAYEFANSLYAELREGKTVGEATRTARLHVRALAPHDPTWIAYSVYAHPNARVGFGAREALRG